MTAMTKRGTPRVREYVANRVRRGATPAERILHHARENEAGCWAWPLKTDSKGYGRMTINGRSGYYAHRVSYEAFVGPIPEGLHLDHLCRNTACCNPEHLEPVTPLVNTRRGMARGVIATACPRGHAYDEANTYRPPGAPNPNGRRMCRACNTARLRLWHAMTPEERAERKAAGLPVVDLDAYFAQQCQEEAA